MKLKVLSLGLAVAFLATACTSKEIKSYGDVRTPQGNGSIGSAGVGSLANVISAASVYADDDSNLDRALFVDNNGEADLYILIGKENGTFEPLVKPALAQYGGMMMVPKVSENPDGRGFEINWGNDAVGRNRWEQTLKVYVRNNVPVVVGLTFISRDTLDPKGGGTCEVDFVKGKALVNGKTRKTVEKKVIPLSDWKDDSLPSVCNF